MTRPVSAMIASATDPGGLLPNSSGQSADPRTHPVLEIGAGTGCNALALARPGYIPDNAARDLGQQVYTTIFTREELTSAAGLLPLALVGDSVYEYEKTHLPDGAWPPKTWYAGWVSGLDVFDVERETSPIEMRWLVYQKAGTG